MGSNCWSSDRHADHAIPRRQLWNTTLQHAVGRSVANGWTTEFICWHRPKRSYGSKDRARWTVPSTAACEASCSEPGPAWGNLASSLYLQCLVDVLELSRSRPNELIMSRRSTLPSWRSAATCDIWTPSPPPLDCLRSVRLQPGHPRLLCSWHVHRQRRRLHSAPVLLLPRCRSSSRSRSRASAP